MNDSIDKKYLWVFFGLVLPLYLLFTFDHSLWNPDETRDAGISWSMAVSHEYAVPRLNGEVFLEKPPLYYWSTAAVYKLAGRITDGLTRLPAVIYGFLGILFTFGIGRRLGGARAGFLSALLLATSFQYYRVSHMTLMDSALAAFVAGAMYFYVVPIYFLFIVFCCLAFYAKGFVAIALIGAVIGADLVSKSEFKKLLRITLSGAVIFILMAGPWIYALWKAGGREYLRIFFIENQFQRFASKVADHTDAPFYLYLLSFPADFLPWTFFFIGGVASVFARRDLKTLLPSRRFPLFWFGLIFILLSVASAKRSIYLLPAFPAAALTAGFWLEDVIAKPHLTRLERILFMIPFFCVAFVGVGLTLDHLLRHKAGITAFLGFFLVIFLAILAWRDYQLKHKLRFIYVTLVLSALNFVLLNLFFMKDLERDKSFLPLIDTVKNQMKIDGAGDDQLLFLRMSEMERGVFTFYWAHNLTDLKSETELKAITDKYPRKSLYFVANRNNLGALQPVIDARFEKLYAYRPDQKTRSYIFYRISPREDTHASKIN